MTALHKVVVDYDLEQLSCGNCGIVFAIPAFLVRAARANSARRFWCPNGHEIGWATSETDMLRAKLKESEAQVARFKEESTFRARQLEAEQRRTAAAKGETTKLRNRAQNGVCPCCHRSFEALARHMATKHPSYDPATIAAKEKP